MGSLLVVAPHLTAALAPPSCSSAVRNGRRRPESGDDDVAPSLEANPLTSHLTATDSGPYHRVKPQSALGLTGISPVSLTCGPHTSGLTWVNPVDC